jgi:hypothetical protein
MMFFLLLLMPCLLSAQDDDEWAKDSQKAQVSPRIELSYKVVLSDGMQKALRKLNPKFKVLTAAQVNPVVMASYTYTDDDSRVAVRVLQSPSAVIGDFNGDGKADAVLLGYDGTSLLVVRLLSTPHGYKADSEAVLPAPEHPDKMQMYYCCIELVKKGTAISYFAEEGGNDKKMTLKTDAYRLVGEKGSSTYYYSQGKWNSVTTMD